MKIQDRNNPEDQLDVVSIYWDNKGQIYFLGIMPNHEGPLVYLMTEVNILDSNLPFRTVFTPTASFPSICHWALVEENLYDDFIDYDPETVAYFLTILRSEKVIDW